MAASHETVLRVCLIVKKHVAVNTFRAIVRDLLEVPGNQSFRETIRRMAEELGVK